MPALGSNYYGGSIMKTLLTACLLLVTSSALAQLSTGETVTCMPMGTNTSCYGSSGNTTIITPMGNGMSTYSTNSGQMGTLYQPAPMTVQPMPAPRYAPEPIKPLQPFHNPYAPQHRR